MADSGFVGRRAELGQLAAVAESALREHRPRSLVVFAGPGAGKSRLLAEGIARYRVERRIRLSGSELERQVPRAGARALLEDTARSAGGTTVRWQDSQEDEAVCARVGAASERFQDGAGGQRK